MLNQTRRLGEAPKKRKYQKPQLKDDDDEFGGSIDDHKLGEENLNAKEGQDNQAEEPVDFQKEKSNQKSIVDQILSLAPVSVHVKSVKPNQSAKKTKKNKRNKSIVKEISAIKTEDVQQESVKVQEGAESKPLPDKKIKEKQDGPISSNWMLFLQTQKKSNAKFSKGTLASQSGFESDYVALDCEFVECGSIEEVARISIVNENMVQLYQSYIKPQYKITDYRSHVSGITYTHIKNAPLWEAEKSKVQKILFKKTVVGHTIEKDLDVLGMVGWFGFKGVIDINKFSQFQENGKLQSLKKLAFVFLEKNIQTGTHSSLQDAKVTMELFKLKKEKILNEIKREKVEKERIEKQRAKAKALKEKKE